MTMRMDLGLTQTIKQIQTLSPQMYMSMEILCLNSLDLEERIDKEMEENVALELSDGTTAETGADAEASADERSAAGEGGEAAGATAAPVADSDEAGDAFDRKVEQWDRYAREDYDYEPSPRLNYDSDKDEKLEALNNTEGRPMSLQEYLEQQVHLLDRKLLGPDPAYIIEVCSAIIYNIDDRGYLMYSLDEIYQSLVGASAAATVTSEGATVISEGASPGAAVSAVISEGAVSGNGVSAPGGEGLSSGLSSDVNGVAAPVAPAPASADVPVSAAVAAPARVISAEMLAVEEMLRLSRLPAREELERALAVIQSLDPPGIGGHDLRECLLLQLRRDGQAYPIETQIIEGHLGDLANNRLPKIAKALGIGVDDVKLAAETITSLNPIPGKLFGGQPTRFVKPDVVVEEVDGHYEVRVESEYLPRLQVSSYYRDLYRNSFKDPELKKFVKKKIESAEWLISAIRQRQSTLQRIAQEVVEIQKGFLDHGISHLKPLKMVEVAERVGVHVSTISRAISGKYIQTPRGIFELKFFFTGGAVKSDGTMEARGSVIQRIKELIEGEDKANPLSDIDIVKKLEENTIKISRRTVTKYREAESIPSSRQRRAY